MIALSGGHFWMGSEDAEGFTNYAEAPVREIEVAPFLIKATTVTNRDFAEFVRAASYVTEAERFDWFYVFILQLPKAKRKKGNFYGRAPTWSIGSV